MPKTCLTNHKGSISHYIMPLVINSPGGGHTHTHTHTHRGQKQFQETRHKKRLAGAWFNKSKRILLT